MNARRLTGMTQGARKRICRKDQKLELAGEDPTPATIKLLHEIRAMYRIGQRLRPCPGCHACMPGVKGWHIDKVRGRFKMPTVAWNCDGSGVLPARSRKVRQ